MDWCCGFHKLLFYRLFTYIGTCRDCFGWSAKHPVLLNNIDPTRQIPQPLSPKSLVLYTPKPLILCPRSCKTLEGNLSRKP